MSDKTYMYRFLDPDGYHLINQSGVQQAAFPMDGCPYNACWDGLLAQDGRVYLAAASEITVGEYAKLVEYCFESNRFHDLFYSRDVILPPPRAITSSKFHTSMNMMEDGRIVMATHTTDKAPSHPTWLYLQYYDNIWEGYPGSSLIVYDPRTGKAENIGIPVPRESLYGGVYNPRNRCYYAIGYARGHLYEYSFVTRRVTDFGKVTEFETFRIHLGPDFNVYGISRSGVMFRLDTVKRELVNLKHTFPPRNGGPDDCMSVYTRSMGGVVNVPGTSKFLFTLFQSEGMYLYDTRTDELKNLGNYRSADAYCEGFGSYEGVFSMQFDGNGVLWYPITCYSSTNSGDFSFRLGPSLMRWDLFHEGRPECLGVIGTPKRANATVSAMMLDNQRNRMYLVDTNHAADGMSLLAIDMNRFLPHMYERGPRCDDPYLYPQTPRYVKMRALTDEHKKIMEENTADFRPAKMIPVCLWRLCRPEDSRVQGLAWVDCETVEGVCGDGRYEKYWFRIKSDGTLEDFQPLEKVPADHRKRLEKNLLPQKTELPSNLDWPCVGGRRYKAVPCADVEWSDGKKLVGTLDGVLAILDGKRVYSLGPAAPSGPIHCLTANAAKTVAYGIAGDPDDLGSVFRYDDERGLRWLGRLYCAGGDYPTAAGNELSSAVINREGTLLAIGTRDRLGVVFLITL